MADVKVLLDNPELKITRVDSYYFITTVNGNKNNYTIALDESQWYKLVSFIYEVF